MPPLETRRPFTRADALAAGISPAVLRGPKFRKIFHGVYVDARVVDHPLVRVQAALLTLPPDSFASHVSAAYLLDLPVPAHSLTHVSVLNVASRCKKDGIKSHLASDDAGVETVSTVRSSGPTRSFVELASVCTLVDLVVAGDALVRRKRITPQGLVAYCENSSDRHAPAARRAAAYVRAKVDSPMESRLRMLLVLAGLPEPEVNLEILDDYGNVVRKYDLCYSGLKLIIEYDGRQHAEQTTQWKRDLKRREALDRAGWRIVIVTSEGIYKSPGETIQRVRLAMKERGYRGLRTQPSSTWRPYFPGR